MKRIKIIQRKFNNVTPIIYWKQLTLYSNIPLDIYLWGISREKQSDIT